jgi:hypothetical protein
LILELGPTSSFLASEFYALSRITRILRDITFIIFKVIPLKMRNPKQRATVRKIPKRFKKGAYRTIVSVDAPPIA